MADFHDRSTCSPLPSLKRARMQCLLLFLCIRQNALTISLRGQFSQDECFRDQASVRVMELPMELWNYGITLWNYHGSSKIRSLVVALFVPEISGLRTGTPTIRLALTSSNYVHINAESRVYRVVSIKQFQSLLVSLLQLLLYLSKNCLHISNIFRL